MFLVLIIQLHPKISGFGYSNGCCYPELYPHPKPNIFRFWYPKNTQYPKILGIHTQYFTQTQKLNVIQVLRQVDLVGGCKNRLDLHWHCANLIIKFNFFKLFKRQNASLTGTLTGHASWVLCVSFSPDNTHFVSSSADKTVKVWSLEKEKDTEKRMKCIHTFYDHQEQVWGVAYNPSATNIMSVSEDRSINIYECPTI